MTSAAVSAEPLSVMSARGSARFWIACDRPCTRSSAFSSRRYHCTWQARRERSSSTPSRSGVTHSPERQIQYLRHAFFAARRFTSVADLNAQLAHWIATTAHQRAVPGDPTGRRVADALAAEQPRLLPLPQHPFSCDLVRPVRSGKTPYVRFDGNDYSIPHPAVRQPLTLVASEDTVRLLDGATEIARHARSYDHRRVVEDPAHIAALAAVKRAAAELRGRDLLRATCPHAAAFLDALAQRGQPLAPHTRQLAAVRPLRGRGPRRGAGRGAAPRGRRRARRRPSPR
jgi:hypothetical protein